jgi:predicted enzyme related to lactoylglutathione lyase
MATLMTCSAVRGFAVRWTTASHAVSLSTDDKVLATLGSETDNSGPEKLNNFGPIVVLAMEAIMPSAWRTDPMLTTAQIVPYIPVADIDRARKFYEEKVGLKPKETYAGGVIYECGHGSWLFMYPSAGAGTSKASTAFWAVDDVVAEVAALKARGVVFEEYDMPEIKTVNGIATVPGAKAAWFKDSEGNILAVSQRLSS